MADASDASKRPRIHHLKTADITQATDKQTAKVDDYISTCLIIAVQIFVVVMVGACDFRYDTHLEAMKYGFFRDVNIMIFFGFGFLMTFLHRHGLSAIGYCLILCCVVAELSIVVEFLLNGAAEETTWGYTVTIEHLMDALFCGGAVMISYGAIIGKVTPAQLLVMAIIEVFAFWANFRVCAGEIGAHDVGGGMVIHMFGAYFGLAVTFWVTRANPKAVENPEEKSIYSSDIFSLAGTIFLWVLWPSFQSAVAAGHAREMVAITNTFISLCSSCMAFAAVSRLINNHKFDVVHMQNATLAGGVVMGVAGDMDMGFHGAMLSGFAAGTLSCVGYSKIMPLLVKLNIHDTCGVNNLHGMPGILGAIVAVIVTAEHNENPGADGIGGFAGIGAPKQIYALLATLAISIGSGFLTGALITFPFRKASVPETEYFNDRLFFGAASDYSASAEADKVEV